MQLPEEFVRETHRLMGEQRFGRFLEALDEEPPVSIRVNPGKTTAVPSGNCLQVGWCPTGYYLPARPNFTFDPLLHAGCYYVQEASSMFIDLVLRQHVKHPVRMLDLCAAPGGKSTAARAALPEGSLLVSNEPIRQRACVLAENIEKWGAADCIVTNNYPKNFRKAKAQFDVILCDVPCSGEGMFRKDPASVGEWTRQNVERCWQLQREIVAEAWHCLTEGGLLIYSTCTYNTKEDEENVQWIERELGGEVLPVVTKAEWNITGSLLEGYDRPVYRFIPGFTKGEGLFMAVLRKPGDRSATIGDACQSKKAAANRQTTNWGKAIKSSALNILYESPKEQPVYPQAALSYQEAVSYLRGEALVLSPDMPRGLVTVTFHGYRLGLVKNIGNRANNLYPKGWRIKSTHVPQESQCFALPLY